MFGVDCNNLPRLGGLGDQRTANHQRLLVGQGEDSPSSQGSQRCRQPGGSRDPVEHGIARHRRHLSCRIRPSDDAG